MNKNQIYEQPGDYGGAYFVNAIGFFVFALKINRKCMYVSR